MEFAAEGSGCKLNELARLGSVYSPNHVSRLVRCSG